MKVAYIGCLLLALFADEGEGASVRGSKDDVVAVEAPPRVRHSSSTALVSVPQRRLAEDAFEPLTCNSSFSSCIPWTSRWGRSAVKTTLIVIPCGQCIVMNLDSPKLTLQEGIDIRGKLVFPDRYELTVETPEVVVQGELEMRSSKLVDGSPAIKFVLYGNGDRHFDPVNNNRNACGGSSCNGGARPITVAGGKVNRKFMSMKNESRWFLHIDS